MKKIFCLILVLMMLTPSLLQAEETIEMAEALAVASDEEMMPRADADMERPGKMPLICPMMEKSSMAATPDGGVVVLVGNKLQKYDADLNFVKEAEIKMPAMMGKKMAEGQKQVEAAPANEASAPAKAVDVAEALDFQPAV